jgi:hypothetical protein
LPKKSSWKGIDATPPVIEPSGFPGGRPFARQFHAKFNSDPIWAARCAYDAMHGLAHRHAPR